MTDLEACVNAPGRADLVKQVREKINELGITYIYYQFISVTGRIVGKGIPADHWERTAERGFQLVYGSTANLFIDRHGGDTLLTQQQIADAIQHRANVKLEIKQVLAFFNGIQDAVCLDEIVKE